MKKALSLFLAFALVAMFATACGGSSADSAAEGTASAAVESTGGNEGGAEAASGDTIKIGALAPLTGGAAQYGMASSNGSKLAVEEINAAGGVLGRQVELLVEDEKGDPTEALNAYNVLVQEKGIVALVGDVTTKPSIAVAQRASQDNIPMITPTGTGIAITESGENVFRACYTDPYQGEIMAHFAKSDMNAATAAILYDTGDDYSQGVADTFEETAKELGIEVLAKEGYQTGAVDFNAQLTKIQQGNPDVIMAPCYYEDAAKIITQARGLGITAKMLGPDGWDSVLGQLDESNYNVLEDSYYCSQFAMPDPGEKLEKFINDYTAAYGDETLNMFAALGYEAMHIMAQAINDAGSEDPDAIVDALSSMVYEGLSANVDFTVGQDPAREAIIIEFADGAEHTLGSYTLEGGLVPVEAGAADADADASSEAEAPASEAEEATSEAESTAEESASEAEAAA